MGMYLDALLLLGAVALIAGIVLTLAAKFMAVPVNETQVKIRECLPEQTAEPAALQAVMTTLALLPMIPIMYRLMHACREAQPAASAIAEVLGKDADAAGGGEAKNCKSSLQR